MLKLRKLLLLNYPFYIIFFISLLFVYINSRIEYKSKYNISNKEFVVQIQNIKFDGNKLNLEIIGKEKLLANYLIETKEDKKKLINNLNIGDTIKITGNLLIPNNNTIPNLFNYKKYLYYHRIYYLLEVDNIIKIKNNTNIFYSIKNIINKKINNYKYSKQYLNAFILGDTSLINSKIKDSYSYNGVTHLFAVSGMHIGVITLILFWLLKKTKIKELYRYIIVILFILFYMFITNFSSSILRSGFFFILLSINKYYYFYIKPINILLLTISVLMFINPFIIFDIGFLYSVLISMFLIVYGNIINKHNNYFVKLFIVSTISFLASLPINIYNFYSINLLSIIINIIFVPFVSLIVFPISIITFIFPFFDKILYFLTLIMENISLFCSNIKVFNIILSKVNVLIIILYYLIIVVVLNKIKNKQYYYIILIILFIFIHTNIRYIDNEFYITFIDVGQGDSCLIELPNNKGNILIDTGGRKNIDLEKWEVRNSNYSISSSSLIPLFKSKGIKKIDYLILTHGDDDHMGEAINLINNFSVDNIYINNGKYTKIEEELIKRRCDVKIKNSNDRFTIDKFTFYILNPIKNINENENSIVMYSKIYNTKILLMGDSGKTSENNILNKYDISNINILKVGHHGSKNSSDLSFLKTIEPETSIISVGKNNRFKHPSSIVLNNLKAVNSKIYRTDLNGSIEIKIDKNNYTIKMYKP